MENHQNIPPYPIVPPPNVPQYPVWPTARPESIPTYPAWPVRPTPPTSLQPRWKRSLPIVAGGVAAVTSVFFGVLAAGSDDSTGVRSAVDDWTIARCANDANGIVEVSGTINNSTGGDAGYWADIQALDADGNVVADIFAQELYVVANETRDFSATGPANGVAVKCVVLDNATRTMGS